jgi:hypothetical protein
MNKEQQELLDDAYVNYITKKHIEFETWRERNSDALVNYREDTKELFLKSIKDNKHWFSGEKNFSDKWGLKIEERELSLEERIRMYALKEGQTYEEFVTNWNTDEQWSEDLSDTAIPTKLITITYNNKTIENYE